MKKTVLLHAFCSGLCMLTGTAFGAYPVYSGYRGNGQMVYLPSNNNGVVIANPAVATQTTRVTGMLPRVGSSATTAGRSYYQPADFDRLADSGLYIGLSAAYTASIMGTMKADYATQDGAADAPGAFKEASFNSDTIIPLQLSLGAAINSDVRVDFSYLRYSGISYPWNVETDDGLGGWVSANATGGAITSNTAMLNLYYNIDSYTGYIAGGSLRPYVGAGVGISLNTIADYVVYDDSIYYFVAEEDLGTADMEEMSALSDIYAYHNGGTSEQLAFALEGGVTTEMEGGVKIDFFVRYANLGKIKTSGSVVMTQTQYYPNGGGGELDYEEIMHNTSWTESGRLSVVDIGARLRLQF